MAAVRRHQTGFGNRAAQLRAMFWKMAQRRSPTAAVSSAAGRILGRHQPAWKHPVQAVQRGYRKATRKHPVGAEFGSLIPIIGAGVVAERGLARSSAWRTATRSIGGETLASAALYTPIVVGTERMLHGPIQHHHGTRRRRRLA